MVSLPIVHLLVDKSYSRIKFFTSAFGIVCFFGSCPIFYFQFGEMTKCQVKGYFSFIPTWLLVDVSLVDASITAMVPDL